jgi:hypothetical protein
MRMLRARSSFAIEIHPAAARRPANVTGRATNITTPRCKVIVVVPPISQVVASADHYVSMCGDLSYFKFI